MKQLFATAAIALASATSLSASTVFINEFHYDNAGIDVGEFVEIAGPAGTDLSAFTLQLVNGSNGVPYNTIPLSGLIDDEGTGFGAVAFFFATNGLQNGGPDAIGLSGPSVSLLISYEGPTTATDGIFDGVTGADIGVGETGTTPVGFSLQLTGTGSKFADFTFVGPQPESPGLLNAGQTLFAAPIPLPAGGVLLLSGLGVAAVVRRRGAQRAAIR